MVLQVVVVLRGEQPKKGVFLRGRAERPLTPELGGFPEAERHRKAEFQQERGKQPLIPALRLLLKPQQQSQRLSAQVLHRVCCQISLRLSSPFLLLSLPALRRRRLRDAPNSQTKPANATGERLF